MPILRAATEGRPYISCVSEEDRGREKWTLINRCASGSTESGMTSSDFSRQLIRIPSVTGEEGKIQQFIAGYLKEMDVQTDVWEPDLAALKLHPAFVEVSRDYKGRPNVVGLLNGSGGGKSLLFNGHVDVIPAGAPESWKHDPWSGDAADGRIYGRGAADMKSGLAAMTMAVKSILAIRHPAERGCDSGIHGG